MLVSIIITNYNYSVFLENCIQSVLDQTYQNFEIIIIDDCSTDNSLQVLQKFSSDSRILVLSNTENKGVCYCRNKGIEESKGEYICLLDADDYWLPSKLEKQLTAVTNQNFNLCFTDIDVLKNQTIIHSRKHAFKKYDYNTLLQRNFIPHSTIMIKKEALENVRYKTIKTNSNFADFLLNLLHIDKLIHEDYAFLLELYRKGNIKSYHVAESLVIYRTHDENFSRDYRKKILSLFFIYKNQERYNFIISLIYTARISILAFIKNNI